MWDQLIKLMQAFSAFLWNRFLVPLWPPFVNALIFSWQGVYQAVMWVYTKALVQKWRHTIKRLKGAHILLLNRALVPMWNRCLVPLWHLSLMLISATWQGLQAVMWVLYRALKPMFHHLIKLMQALPAVLWNRYLVPLWEMTIKIGKGGKEIVLNLLEQLWHHSLMLIKEKWQSLVLQAPVYVKDLWVPLWHHSLILIRTKVQKVCNFASVWMVQSVKLIRRLPAVLWSHFIAPIWEISKTFVEGAKTLLLNRALMPIWNQSIKLILLTWPGAPADVWNLGRVALILVVLLLSIIILLSVFEFASRQQQRQRLAARRQQPQLQLQLQQLLRQYVEAVHALLQVTTADVEPPNIPFSVLEHWTEGFAEGRLVGSGGFGNVYRGEYADNERRLYGRVAVKRVSQELFGAGTAFQQQSLQDGAMASMRREIAVLRAFKHPNIIKLLGFHMPEGGDNSLKRLCLVYEMASNGSLDRWLTDDDKAARLDWRQRAQIAVGIATALNYLHCHNPGHPAYHRDVKSANIALTVDFCPKLLDCGLAKFIPAGGAPMQTVFTRTGQVFGTPGYMCQQYVNSGVYDAKSEVYAFGIVLAELFGGKLQNQGGVVISDEALDDDDIVPDARIIGDGCPADFLPRWKTLCVNSLKSYKKRVPAMMTVVRELRSLSSMYASVVTAGVEEELNRLRRELEEVRLKDTVEQRLQREDSLRSKRECQMCCDVECRLEGGVECSQGHFICDGCFRGDNLAHQISAGNRGNFKAHGSKLVCQWCLPGPPVHVFEDDVTAAHLGAEAFGRYLAAREEVVAVEVFRNAEANFQVRLEAMRKENAAAAAAAAATAAAAARDQGLAAAARDQRLAAAAVATAAARDQRLRRHRLHIAENILTLKCPRASCRQAIFDFEACFAITCPNCQCGFCGWCLADCGRDAHPHVKQCPSAPARHRGGYHGTLAEFNAVHVEKRRTEVARYLREQVLEGDRDRVKKAIALDLGDLGIRL